MHIQIFCSYYKKNIHFDVDQGFVLAKFHHSYFLTLFITGECLAVSRDTGQRVKIKKKNILKLVNFFIIIFNNEISISSLIKTRILQYPLSFLGYELMNCNIFIWTNSQSAISHGGCKTNKIQLCTLLLGVTNKYFPMHHVLICMINKMFLQVEFDFQYPIYH